MFSSPRAFVRPLSFRSAELCSLSKARIQKTLIAPLILTLITIAAFSQNTTTSMRGTVTDPQAAVVANAEVTLQNSATGLARNQKTSDRGEYQFLQIPPGTYSINTTAAGFVTSRKENVVLLVNTPATLNFALKVGAADTIVDVSAEATTVNIVDATIGNPFDSKQILELPSEGRNAVELLSLQAGVTYTGTKGRFGRRLLQEVDMATPENLRDPKSGMTYFQAATALVKLANANTNESAVKPIAYWENLFPAAAGGAGESGYAPGTPAIPTATQNIYDLYYANNPNATYALLSLDTTCFPACSTLGPYAYWDSQFSSLYSWRGTGTSNYNGLQATLRRRVASLELDLNYTYSKSLDENSNAERVNEYEAGSNGATAVSYSGQVVNAWMPHQLYGPSDFDLRHQFNANWVYDLPFGRGKRFGSESSKVVDGILGGWEFSGLTRWTSGYPFSVDSYAFATDYEQDGRAVLLGAAPTTGTYIDSGGNPNVFKAGTGARSAFRFAYPGESGQRNNLRGPGYFGTDMSLAKLWRFGETQSIRLSWDAFNVTNSARFDVGTIGNYLLYPQQLGEFTQTMTHPRVMQFGLRYWHRRPSRKKRATSC